MEKHLKAIKVQEKDFLWLHLRDLPYFRSITRTVEAGFYQEFELSRPVLDVGCGDGHFASIAFDSPIDVGLDPWYRPVHEAAGRGGYCYLVQADGGKMPFPDAYFNSAISNSVLEHIPHVEAVLADTARVLKPGSLFLFCVPNPAYYSELALPRILQQVGLKRLGQAYIHWFGRISRVVHADTPETWQRRLEQAGFQLERWWHYLSPAAWRIVEWGHYLGVPSLFFKKLTGHWILVPTRWNLAITEGIVRPYTKSVQDPSGVFTFYVARKKGSSPS
ncbi:MAG: class I SAM-dependent methyltransferase [Omnitrophica WOR_2 bacterium]